VYAEASRREEHAMAEIGFGLFDWIDRATAPLHQLYEERLRLFGGSG
jgi:hypothetical protein